MTDKALPRCHAVLSVYSSPRLAETYANGEVIESDTQLVGCLLLAGHEGNHRTLVNGRSIEFPVRK